MIQVATYILTVIPVVVDVHVNNNNKMKWEKI